MLYRFDLPMTNLCYDLDLVIAVLRQRGVHPVPADARLAAEERSHCQIEQPRKRLEAEMWLNCRPLGHATAG